MSGSTDVTLGSLTAGNSIPEGAGVLMRVPGSDPSKFVFAVVLPEALGGGSLSFAVNAGHLILTKADGTTADLGNVQGASVDGVLLSALQPVALTGNTAIVAGDTSGNPGTTSPLAILDYIKSQIPNASTASTFTSSLSSDQILALRNGALVLLTPGALGSVSAPTNSALTVTPPSGAIEGASSSATISFSGLTLPLSYSLDNALFTALSPQPASGATTATISLGVLSAGQHTLLVKDVNNTFSNGGSPASFTVASANTGQYAAPGLPSVGIGFYQDVLQGNSTSGNGYDANIDNQILQTNMYPPMVLVFPGTFNSIGDVVYRYNLEASTWKNNANTNGSKRPIPIPVIALPGWYLDKGLTHLSVLTGAYDSQLEQIVTGWASANVPALYVRMCGWEIDYTTTLDGQGAQNKGYGSGQTANSSDSAYCAQYIAAYRYMSRIMRAKAASLGLVFKTIWEPAHISYCFIDPRLTFPDNDVSDGYGKQVDINGADFYYNNFFGGTVPILHDGYDQVPPMTPFAATGTAPDIPTWAQNKGSLYYFGDFVDNNSTDPYSWGGGWSLFEMINFAATCPLGPNPIIHPEMGGVTFLDGGINGGLTVTQPDGPAGSHDDYGPFFSPHQAGYLRSRWAYAQSLGVEVIGGCLWFYQSNQSLQTYAAAFPEKTLNYTGPKVSQIAAPIPRISVVQPEYHVKPNVSFPLKAFWAVNKPTALDISFDGGTTFGAVASSTINADRSMVISTKFTAPGYYRIVLRDSNNSSVLGKTNNFYVPNTGQAYTKSTAAMYPGLNSFRITVKVQPSSLTSGGYIFGIWSNTASLAYTTYIDGNGKPNIIYFDGANYIGAGSTVALSSSITTTSAYLRFTVTPTTGVILFETSANGSTWTQLGDITTNTLKTAVNGAGLANGAYACIGGAEDGTGLFSGKIFDVKLEISGNVVFDYNFATQQVTNNTSTDSAGNVWAVYNPAVTTSTGSGTSTPAPTLLSNMRTLNIATAGNNTITLPNAATAGNHVLLLQNSYNEPAPTFSPATPAGFTSIGRIRGGYQDFSAFFGPVSALVNNGVTFNIQVDQDATYGGFVLVETTAGHATATALIGQADGNSPNFSMTVPTQGGTSPLLVGFLTAYTSAGSQGLSATQGGSILYQNNNAPNGMENVLFTQAAPGTPVQFTQVAGANTNANSVNGIGLELTA